tara:strand:- start:3324 stop:4001 length:678 start_codon:yes stop_codon:yes gene_type:complete
MTVPSSQLEKTLGRIRQELELDINDAANTNYDVGPYTTNPTGINEAEIGTYDAVNQNSTLKPDGSNPSSFDEWSEYSHAATVLCTELYHQGKLEKDAYRRDKEMTDSWMAKRPLLKAGYLCFAHWPLWMLRNKKEFAEKYMHHIVIAFSNFYADKHPSTKKKYKKNNWVGKSMMIFGLLFFPLLGLLTKVSKNKNYRLILSTITTMFWFVPLFIYSIIIKILKKL